MLQMKIKSKQGIMFQKRQEVGGLIVSGFNV
jgi:hypothetical protein